MKQASLLASAALVAFTTVANAQSPAEDNPETLSTNYVDAAMQEAQKACDGVSPSEANLRFCVEKAFEAETKLFVHWRNVATQYLYDLPFPTNLLGDAGIGFSISQVDLACRFPAQDVVNASEKDVSTLADVFDRYQKGCSSALGEQTENLKDYKLPFMATPNDYGKIHSYAGGVLQAIRN